MPRTFRGSVERGRSFFFTDFRPKAKVILVEGIEEGEMFERV